MHRLSSRLVFALRQFAVWAGVLALVVAVAPAGRADAAQTPAITLDPNRGPCETRPVVRGTGFPAGATIAIFSERTSPPGEKAGSQIAEATAGADGAFAVTLLVIGGDCIDLDARTPEGTQYTFTAVASGPGVPDGRDPVARAVFTIDRSVPVNFQCFPETNYCVQGRFLQYWRTHGGLAINGYPISDEFEQRLEDGKTYRVQYFERVRLEYHPENSPPYDVLLGHFGRRILAAVPDAPTAPVAPSAGYTYFAETGHNVGPRFLAYWTANGGLMQFGYPLSELFEERLEDGKVYLVQYFERARFEYHPENPAPYDVQLGHFGRRILGPTGGPNMP